MMGFRYAHLHFNRTKNKSWLNHTPLVFHAGLQGKFDAHTAPGTASLHRSIDAAHTVSKRALVASRPYRDVFIINDLPTNSLTCNL
jgi:hypothetical protein